MRTGIQHKSFKTGLNCLSNCSNMSCVTIIEGKYMMERSQEHENGSDNETVCNVMLFIMSLSLLRSTLLYINYQLPTKCLCFHHSTTSST